MKIYKQNLKLLSKKLKGMLIVVTEQLMVHYKSKVCQWAIIGFTKLEGSRWSVTLGQNPFEDFPKVS